MDYFDAAESIRRRETTQPAPVPATGATVVASPVGAPLAQLESSPARAGEPVLTDDYGDFVREIVRKSKNVPPINIRKRKP